MEDLGFDYFIIRLNRSARTPSQLSGMVERLGSGEKRHFDSGDQLVRLVAPAPDSMPLHQHETSA